MHIQRTVVFMVTNGSGLGHLTRGLAVASRLKKIDDAINIIFVTTSLATEVIREAGFMFYYIPTRGLMPVRSDEWNAYLQLQLQQIIEIYQPIAFVYDGAYPYACIMTQLTQCKHIKKIWIKRECYKENSMSFEKEEKRFDLIIVPKESSEEIESRASNKVYCEPIIFLDEEEALPRNQIRERFNLTEEDRLFYVQLGAGVINEINEYLEIVITALLKKPNYYVLLGESIIGGHLSIQNPRVITIRNYPNSQYFIGIDGAISAAGYNTFHELLYFGVPSIFIPNQQTILDNQLARIEMAVRQGAALYNEIIDEAYIMQAINYIAANQGEMKINGKSLVRKNGALEAARLIQTIM